MRNIRDDLQDRANQLAEPPVAVPKLRRFKDVQVPAPGLA